MQADFRSYAFRRVGKPQCRVARVRVVGEDAAALVHITLRWMALACLARIIFHLIRNQIFNPAAYII